MTCLQPVTWDLSLASSPRSPAITAHLRLRPQTQMSLASRGPHGGGGSWLRGPRHNWIRSQQSLPEQLAVTRAQAGGPRAQVSEQMGAASLGGALFPGKQEEESAGGSKALPGPDPEPADTGGLCSANPGQSRFCPPGCSDPACGPPSILAFPL